MSERPLIKPEQSEEAGTRRLREAPPPSRGEAAGENGDDCAAEAGRKARRLRERAEHLMHEAQRRAEEYLTEAEEKAEELRAEAERRGYEDGFERGRVEAAEAAEEMSAQLRQDWEVARDRLQGRMDELGDQMVDIIVRVCEQVLREQLDDRRVVVERVKECLGRFSDISDITLVVSAVDMNEILQRRTELEDEVPPRTELLITTDEALDAGEFRIRGDEGVFEGTVADITSALRRHFEKALMGAADES